MPHEPSSMDTLAVEEAFDTGFDDYEDAVHEAARHASAEAIVTRNVSDFEAATLAIYAPGDLPGTLTDAA